MCHEPHATTDVAPPDPTDPLLRVADVAKKLNVHVSTVYRLADSGRLRAHALGGGMHRRRGLRIPASAVDALLRETELSA